MTALYPVRNPDPNSAPHTLLVHTGSGQDKPQHTPYQIKLAGDGCAAGLHLVLMEQERALRAFQGECARIHANIGEDLESLRRDVSRLASSLAPCILHALERRLKKHTDGPQEPEVVQTVRGLRAGAAREGLE